MKKVGYMSFVAVAALIVAGVAGATPFTVNVTADREVKGLFNIAFVSNAVTAEVQGSKQTLRVPTDPAAGTREALLDYDGIRWLLQCGHETDVDYVVDPVRLPAGTDVSAWPKRTLPPPPDARPLSRPVQYWTPDGWNTWVGDVTVCTWKGRLHLFYLLDRRHHRSKGKRGGHYFEHLSTDDLVHWTEHPPAVPPTERWECIGTGMPLVRGDELLLFYGLHTTRCVDEKETTQPQQDAFFSRNARELELDFADAKGLPIGGTYSVSTDGVHFVKSRKLVTRDQNPSPVRLGDGRIGLYRSGLGGIWTSDRIGGWKPEQDGIPSMGDCPCPFEWNGWHYIIQGFCCMVASRQEVGGEWRDLVASGEDIYDGLAVPMVTTFGNGRRIIAGWIQHPDGWGGWLCLRELVQHPDGRLGIRWIPELPTPGQPQTFACDGKKPLVVRFRGEQGGELEFRVDPADARAQFADVRDGAVPRVQTLEEICRAAEGGKFTDRYDRMMKGRRTDNVERDVAIGRILGVNRPFSVRLVPHYDAKSDVTVFDAEIAAERTLLCVRRGRYEQVAKKCPLPTFLTVAPLSASDAEGVVADAVAFVRDTPADAIAWSCTLVPEGDPAINKAAVLAPRIRRHVEALRKLSDAPWGVLFQATVGHGWAPMSRTPWQKVIGANGREHYKFCPLGAEIRAYVAEQAKTLAATGPDFFMVDDDTRLITGFDGCYCPLHLAEFGRRTGRTWTRETLVGAMKEDEALARQYDELLRDSFVPFMQAIRAAFPAETPGYFCCCNLDAHHAYDLAKALAAPGQRPVIRINNAIYVCGNDPLQVPRILSQTAREIADLRGEATVLCENDPCPQNRNSLGAVPLANHLVMSILEGCDGAKIWPLRLGNPHERKSFEAYRAGLGSVRGTVDVLRAMKLRRTGVVIPLPRERPFAAKLSGDPQDWSTRYFARVGIPFRFGAPGTNDVVALSEPDLAYFGDAELERLLAGRVLLDGAAAIGLTRRGFGPLIGVEAKPWTGKPISLERYGTTVLNGGVSEAADLTARAAESVVRSRLFHCASSLSSASDELGPGSLLFRNRLGGRVFTIAAALPATRPGLTRWHYFNETRKRAVVAALRELGGEGVMSAYYPDDAETVFETGVAADGANVFVFDNLGIDTLENPEVVFATVPAKVERLSGDGRWQPVAFDNLGDGRCRLRDTRIETLRPAIFRW